MSTTTQNDWETEFRYKFEGANVTISSRMMDSLVADIHKIVADARKEECRQRLFTIDGLKKTCGICGVIKETAFHKDASQSHDGCENNYNKAIDDVLATLRKEQPEPDLTLDELDEQIKKVPKVIRENL
jgi:hypothetical protein